MSTGLGEHATPANHQPLPSTRTIFGNGMASTQPSVRKKASAEEIEPAEERCSLQVLAADGKQQAQHAVQDAARAYRKYLDKSEVELTNFDKYGVRKVVYDKELKEKLKALTDDVVAKDLNWGPEEEQQSLFDKYKYSAAWRRGREREEIMLYARRCKSVLL